MCVKWNENGNWLLTASRDHIIKIYDIRAMKEMCVLRSHKKDVNSKELLYCWLYQFAALLIREIVFLDATISIIRCILCLFLVETRTLNDNSSRSSMPIYSFFKRDHESIGQSLQQTCCNNSLLAKKIIFDRELIEPICIAHI